MMNIRRSFSAKVIMWVLLLAVPVFLASVGVLFWQSHKLIRAEAVDKASNVLACAMHRINRYLITTKTASHTNAWIVEQSLYPDSIQAITNRIATTNPYTDGCAISTEPGVIPQYPDGFMSVSFNTKDSVNTFIEPDHSYFQERWYSIPRTQRKPTWVVFNDKNREQETDEDATIAAYTHPLFNKKGKFVGVISIWLSLQHISNIMAEVRPYPHSYYVMIDEKGRYVGHPDSTRLFNQTIFSVADPQHQADLIALGYEMTKGNKGSMSVIINGKKSLVCYMPVEGTPWSLAIVCPHSDILRGFYRLTYIVVALLIVGLLLIFINCHKAVTVSLSPLQQLLEKTKAVSNGHLDVDIAHTKRTDVIGGLQNSFATMLESLNYYINSVRTATDQTKRYNRELEHTTQLAVEAQRQKTIFIQNVTHQIRTPLNIIMGFAQILNCPTDDTSLSEELGQDEIKSIASTMTHNSRLLIRMVMMLFDSSDYNMLLNGVLSAFDYFNNWEADLLDAGGRNAPLQEFVDIAAPVFENPLAVGSLDMGFIVSSDLSGHRVDPLWENICMGTADVNPALYEPYLDAVGNKIEDLSEIPQLVRNVYEGGDPVVMLYLPRDEGVAGYISVLQENGRLTENPTVLYQTM